MFKLLLLYCRYHFDCYKMISDGSDGLGKDGEIGKDETQIQSTFWNDYITFKTSKLNIRKT